jgi:hypothetical protein
MHPVRIFQGLTTDNRRLTTDNRPLTTDLGLDDKNVLTVNFYPDTECTHQGLEGPKRFPPRRNRDILGLMRRSHGRGSTPHLVDQEIWIRTAGVSSHLELSAEFALRWPGARAEFCKGIPLSCAL